MKFLEIAKNLQNEEENKGTIVLIRCGAFFVSIGKDAVILSEQLNLNVNCITNRICKVGIPVNAIYDYIKRLEKIGFNFVIYNYSKDEMVENGKRYAEAYRFKGKPIIEKEVCLYCERCVRYKKHETFDNLTLFKDLKRLQELRDNNV